MVGYVTLRGIFWGAVCGGLLALVIGLFVEAMTSGGDSTSTSWALGQSGVLAVMFWGLTSGVVLGLIAGVCAGGAPVPFSPRRVPRWRR